MHESSIKIYGWFYVKVKENVQILRLFVQVKMETMVHSVGNY